METLDDEPTSQQAKLERLNHQIGGKGLVCALLLVLLLVGRWFVDFAAADFAWRDEYAAWVLQQLLVGVALVVLAVPEGLPLAASTVMAHASNRMLDDRLLIRNLDSLEAAAACTTICTDKSGTLTTNQMEVQRIWLGSNLYRIVPPVMMLLAAPLTFIAVARC